MVASELYENALPVVEKVSWVVPATALLHVIVSVCVLDVCVADTPIAAIEPKLTGFGVTFTVSSDKVALSAMSLVAVPLPAIAVRKTPLYVFAKALACRDRVTVVVKTL